MGDGVRTLSLENQLPDCEIYINRTLYQLEDLVKGKKVVDIGCGHGPNKPIVEEAGGEWVGVEPFEGGAHTVIGDAEDLPFEDASFDIAIMDAVLEHIPNVSNAFREVSRILKPGGLFIGYVAFMECFHEISYSHLSFKALEHFSNINGLKLEKVAGGRRFGADYHFQVTWHPLSLGFWRRFMAWRRRAFFRLKSWFAYLGLRLLRGMSRAQAADKARKYYQLECLRQSVGFNYIIRKL